jgi:predicted AlkP superfamily phosphohydrolase/phosphomutase
METNTSEKITRQLLVGLDAMEWNLVTRWTAAGKLPTFRRLIEQGTRAELATTAAQLPDTVWACLYTGVNPAKFEKYFYVQYDPRTQGLRHVLDDEITRPPLWDYLSQAGLRVGVVDVPKFKLSQSLNGFQLTNWGAHATKTARASSPSSLLNEVNARFGRHPVGDCDAVDAKPHALTELRRKVIEGVHRHGELFRWLMHERRWDVFFAGFSAPHCIGHHFWHGADPSHPRHHEAADHGLADTIEQVYRAIDRELGEMIAMVGPETLVMVTAAHGMGPVYHASWNLPEILDLLGYGNKPALKPTGEETREAHVNPWRVLKMTIPGAWQYRIKAMLPEAMQDQLLFLWYSGGRNWEGSRAFAIPNNDMVGAIRLAVKGRDRHGLIEPGEEYRRICRDIGRALSELTDIESERPVVERVTYLHEVFDGPFLNQLPDLAVFWNNSFPWSSLHSPRFGTLRLRRQDSRTGGHSSHGFMIARGPGIPAGTELFGHSIYDIAPTVLEAAGVAAPPDFDGRPIWLQRQRSTQDATPDNYRSRDVARSST